MMVESPVVHPACRSPCDGVQRRSQRFRLWIGNKRSGPAVRIQLGWTARTLALPHHPGAGPSLAGTGTAPGIATAAGEAMGCSLVDHPVEMVAV